MARTLIRIPRGGRRLEVAAGGSINIAAGGRINLAPGATASVGQLSPVNAVASSMTTALDGDNNDMVYTAKVKGEAGDDITIEYIDPEEDTAETTAAVTGTAIAVTLAYANDAITAKASDVKAAIEAVPAAAALVTVANADGNTGAGVVTAMEATPLAGGVDGTVGLAGDMYADDTYLYVAKDDNTVADGNWRRIALGNEY